MAGDKPIDPLPGSNIRGLYVVKACAIVGAVALVWVVKWFVSPTAPAGPAILAVLPSLLPTLLVVAWRGDVPADG